MHKTGSGSWSEGGGGVREGSTGSGWWEGCPSSLFPCLIVSRDGRHERHGMLPNVPVCAPCTNPARPACHAHPHPHPHPHTRTSYTHIIYAHHTTPCTHKHTHAHMSPPPFTHALRTLRLRRAGCCWTNPHTRRYAATAAAGIHGSAAFQTRSGRPAGAAGAAGTASE